MNLLELKNHIELIEIVQNMSDYLISTGLKEVTAPNGNTVQVIEIYNACESILGGSDIDESYIIEISSWRDILAEEY